MNHSRNKKRGRDEPPPLPTLERSKIEQIVLNFDCARGVHSSFHCSLVLVKVRHVEKIP